MIKLTVIYSAFTQIKESKMNDFEYFKPYEGDKPYIFISYAHADDDVVLPIVSDMHRRGYNIWYDEGIEVGSEWQECIASHLADAHLVVAFISNAYMRSDNCRREMHYAQSKKIKTINIFVEDTALTPGMELQIGNIYALMKYTYPSDEYFYDKLYSAPLLNSENFADSAPRPTTETQKAAPVPPPKKKEKKEKKEKKKSGKAKKIIGWSAAVVVFGLILAALIVGYFTGYLEKLLTPTTQIETLADDTVCEFKNSIFENAAREYTGKSDGDITVGELKGLTELYIVGDEYSLSEPVSGIGKVSQSDKTASYTDWQGNSRTVSRGSVSDLSDIAYFTGLKTLWLQYQSLGSLSTMPACSITSLNLDGSRVTELTGIGNLPKLRKLSANYAPLSSLGDLKKCHELTHASFIGASVTDLSAFKPLTKIQSVAFSNCSLSDISQVLDMSSLRSVKLYDCNLSGSFFSSFDRERAITELELVSCTVDSTSGLSDFTGLTMLRLTGTRGVSDWSELDSLTALKTVYIDEGLAGSFTGEHGFEVITE